MSNPNAMLSKAATSGLKWNYAGMAVRSLSALLVGIVLARLLGPQPFGEVALATLVISLGSLLADCGLGAALVQRQSLNADEIRFTFWLQVLLSCMLALLCFAFAGSIAALFHTASVKPVIQALALMFPLQAGQTAVSLLKRRLAFRVIQTVQITSYLVGYVAVGIPLACSGFGVWALVIAQLVQTFVNSMLAFFFAPHPISPRFCIKHDSIFRFGITVAGTNAINWTILNLDNTFIGRAFGATPLALYNRAYNIATAPLGIFVTTLQQVLFPTSSRLQNERAVLGRVYLGVIAVIAALLMPLFAVLAVIPSTVMLGLYGEKWAHASAMLVPLAMAMPLYLVTGVAGPLLWGIGKPKLELRAEVITAVFAISAFWFACRWSAIMVAWAVVIVYALRFTLIVHTTIRLLALRWSDVVMAIRGPVLLAILAGCFASAADLLLLRVCLGALWRLLADTGAASAAVWIACTIAPRVVIGRQAISAIAFMQDDMPSWIFRFFPRLNPDRLVRATATSQPAIQ